MLETLREFANQQAHKDDRNALRYAHAHHFLAFAEQGGPELFGPTRFNGCIV